ncbi:dihydroorotate dehydrogenase (quinone), partial [Flavobacteriaceae bacterium]|nr:dihydroorotate dehydrogenase (quinone) [Flavobacteriaceae bacterium]
DLSNDQLLSIIDVVTKTSIDGIIATNTTIQRENLKSSKNITTEPGGLSGAPLTNRSTDVIRFLYKFSNGKIPIIGVGGIMNPNDAIEKIKAGASLVQLYSGFVYSGPSLVRQINKTILDFRLNQ